MDWDDVRVFEAIADAPTLSEAARRLKVSVATVHRRLDIFETALGLRLVERTHAGVYLTQDGLAVLDRARAAALAMTEIPRCAGTLRQTGEQPVRISAPEPIMSTFLAPVLPALLKRNPALRIEIATVSDGPVPHDAEIALRFARPEGGTLMVQRLGLLRFGLYAAPPFLNGRSPDQLDPRVERLLTGDEHPDETAWLARHQLAAEVVLRASCTTALLTATLAGVGIGLLPDLIARKHDTLVPIPVPEPIPERLIWLMTYRDLRGSPRHRAVRAWVLETLQAAGVAFRTRATEMLAEMDAVA
ncbi:MAG: LysR family transcriptional regulator [Acetobacteraceae bacterium]|nr:LysR family transcriptional regulator [Acetobacteraceae bacterium]